MKISQIKQKVQQNSFPMVLFLVMMLSFGLLIPFLRLYWDDWPAIALARLRGVGAFWEFYQGERPFSAWTYILTMPVLGTHPITWHVFTLLLRWLATLAMWWTLRVLWPGRAREANWIALLFAIYPVFTQQPVAVAFSQHWLTFALFFLSLGAMLQSIRNKQCSWLWTILALCAQGLQIFTMEYFWGLEFLRPVLIWIVLTEGLQDRRKCLVETIKRWLPYLIVLVLGLIVRMIFYVSPAVDPNKPDLLYSLKDQPLPTLVRLLQLVLQDFVYNLVGAWYETLQPLSIDLTDRVFLFSLLICFLTGGLIFFYLLRLQKTQMDTEADRRSWIRQALLVGLLAAFLGPIPVWLTDRQVLWGLWGGRFALAAMFGLSIFFFALLEWFTPRSIPKILVVALLVGLAAGFHVRNAVQFYRSSLKQNQFYWQLYWRAPYLQPGTAILSADELFLYVGRASTAMALNLLYPQEQGDNNLDYWFLELAHDVGPKMVPKLARNIPLNEVFRNFTFSGNGLDSLVIYYKSGTGRCLWVLSPEDSENPNIPDLTRQALPASNLSRIIPEAVSGEYPPTDLFGEEPAHDWCYYYQKADLAKQLGDWAEVTRLGQEADILGFRPGDAHEWIPFIQGYAFTNDWEKAIARTQDAFEMNSEIGSRLCTLWSDIQKTNPPGHEFSEKIQKLYQLIKCN